MANVRIDDNGIAKGDVFEHRPAVLHRSGVTAVDVTDPASPAEGVEVDGFRFIDFDVDVTLGGTDPLVEIAPMFYDAAADAWFAGAASFVAQSGRSRLRVEALGSVTYLQVRSLSGTAPTLSLSVWASLA